MSSPKQKAEKTRYTMERRDKEQYPSHPETPRKADGTPIRKPGGQPGPRAKYDSPIRDAQVAAKQKAFLEAFPRTGTISGTIRAMGDVAQTLGLTPRTVSGWKSENIQSFREKFEAVQLEFSEYLEDVALTRVINAKPTDKMGSDLLLITLLNANNPAKYKRHSNVTDSTGREALAELRTIKQHLKMHPEMGPQTPEDDRESNREIAERLLHERFTPGDNDAS
jgi:hypothetical protein